jgi:hypothetical protein
MNDQVADLVTANLDFARLCSTILAVSAKEEGGKPQSSHRRHKPKLTMPPPWLHRALHLIGVQRAINWGGMQSYGVCYSSA